MLLLPGRKVTPSSQSGRFNRMNKTSSQKKKNFARKPDLISRVISPEIDSPPVLSSEGLVPLESVLFTEELNRRPSRPPDYATENRALAVLVQALADSPQTILQSLTDMILEVFQADSAGISLLTKDEKRFHWPAISGVWKPHIGGGTPREFGPCGDVLDCNAPLLFKRLERRYTYFLPVKPLIEECLLIPFYVAGKAVGTLWMIAHNTRRKFDAEDLRQLESLGRFAAAAFNVELREEALRKSEERFRALFDLGPVAIYSCDLSGTVQEFNACAVKLWGREPKRGDTSERFCGSFKLFFPDGTLLTHDRTPVAAVLSGEIPAAHNVEVVMERTDGSRITVIANIVPLKNGKGEITGAMNCFYDISKRKQAEELLRRSEGKLRDFVENASVGLHWVGPDGIILWANQTELDLLGYTHEEYIGHHIAEFHADPPVIEDILVRLTGGETLLDYEARLRCKNGSIRHVLINSNTLVEDEKFIHTRCFTRDVTEHKRADEALRESEERFRAAVGIVSSLIWTNNAQGLMEGEQLGWSNFTGQTLEEYQGYGWARAVHPEDATPTIAAWDQAVAEKRLFEFEHRLRRRDGAWRLCSVRAMPLLGEDGTIREWVGVHTDITERKQAEDALRESEAFSRSVVESSPDCIKVLDLEGNLLSMQNGQALLGIEDIRPYLNKSWIEFWEDEDRQTARVAVAAAAAGGEGNFVGFFRTLRGEPKWCDVKISSILDADGQPARLLAVSRDVTGRRRAELNFKFLAAVSHDLMRCTGIVEMMQTVGAKIGAHLDLSLCAFAEIDETAQQVVISQDWHREDVPGLVGVYRLADFVEEQFIRTARAEEIIVVRDTAADARTTPEKFAALKIASFICAPLIRDGQWRFALCLYHSTPHDWREDEIELARELTVRLWTRLERLRAEEALRESQRFLRSSLDALSGHIAVLDESGNILEVNEAWRRFADENQFTAPDYGIGSSYLQVCEPTLPQESEAPDYASGINDVIAGRRTHFEIEYPCHSATEQRWFVMRVTRFQSSGPVRIVIVHDNCTERKLAEDALRASESRFRLMADAAPVLIWLSGTTSSASGSTRPGSTSPAAQWSRRSETAGPRMSIPPTLITVSRPMVRPSTPAHRFRWNTGSNATMENTAGFSILASPVTRRNTSSAATSEVAPTSPNSSRPKRRCANPKSATAICSIRWMKAFARSR